MQTLDRLLRRTLINILAALVGVHEVICEFRTAG